MPKTFRTISREDKRITECEEYNMIMKTENHHDHEIILVGEQLRWKPDQMVNILYECIADKNDAYAALHSAGLHENSEIYRKFFRDLGYSLAGYWEIFYWEMNNEFASEYNPQIKGTSNA